MVSVLTSSAVDRGFQPRLGQTKDYKFGICCFSAKHATLRRKSKDWLARNQDNVSEWGEMSTRGLLFRWASTKKIQQNVLVYYKADLIIIISLKTNLFSPWYSWVGVTQQSLTKRGTNLQIPSLTKRGTNLQIPSLTKRGTNLQIPSLTKRRTNLQIPSLTKRGTNLQIPSLTKRGTNLQIPYQRPT